MYGSGSVVGNAIVEHPDIDLVSFTGSNEVGAKINGRAGELLKRTSLEMGGKNAVTVLEDADLDLAADGIVWSAFGTSGQRCTACSRVIVQESVKEALEQKVLEKMKDLKLGDGLDESVDVGPVINRDALEKIHEYVKIGKEEERSSWQAGKSPQKTDWIKETSISRLFSRMSDPTCGSARKKFSDRSYLSFL